ncbi:MAG: thioesterase family protein [Alcanivorax sp.]|nr:thioesterase family protein [Alcanivorax sp.]
MLFEQIIAAANVDEIDIPSGWSQGRALFGGLVGALLYQRTASLVPHSRLRALSINFIGPVATGPARLQASILRQGKSVTQAQAQLIQGDQVQAMMLASFGAGRDSGIRVAAEPAPPYCKPEEQQTMPFLEGVSPAFLKHFDVRWAEGYFPYTGGDHGNLGGWERFHDASGPLTTAHLVALVDVWPPATVGMLKTPAPASSMTWTMELVDDLAGQQADDWYRYRANTEFAAEGYTHAAARLWDRHGKLLAISRQTAVVFG